MPLASGATPMAVPPIPPPTMRPMVCVPWPSGSYGLACSPCGSYQLLAPPRHLPARSGCKGSTPVSMLATTMPLPVSPCDQRSGARTAFRFHSGGAGLPAAVTGACRIESRRTLSTPGSCASIFTFEAGTVSAMPLITQSGRTRRAGLACSHVCNGPCVAAALALSAMNRRASRWRRSVTSNRSGSTRSAKDTITATSSSASRAASSADSSGLMTVPCTPAAPRRVSVVAAARTRGLEGMLHLTSSLDRQVFDFLFADHQRDLAALLQVAAGVAEQHRVIAIHEDLATTPGRTQCADLGRGGYTEPGAAAVQQVGLDVAVQHRRSRVSVVLPTSGFGVSPVAGAAPGAGFEGLAAPVAGPGQLRVVASNSSQAPTARHGTRLACPTA